MQIRLHISLLFLRLITGIIFIIHGYPRLVDVSPYVSALSSYGIPSFPWIVITLGILEFAGGIFLLLGLLTRVVGTLLALEMFAALVIVELPQGFLEDAQLKFVLFGISVIFVLLGAGFISLDRWIASHRSLLRRWI